MRTPMKLANLSPMTLLLSLFTAALLVACGPETAGPETIADAHSKTAEPARGAHGGRLLIDGAFALEVAIFETGVPPEFHAWATLDGQPLAPADIRLDVTLTRLGGEIDTIRFAPEDGFLRGDAEVREPHSFDVTVTARHAGSEHRWTYESHEGRVRIPAEVAAASRLVTEAAGPAQLVETLNLYGRIAADAERRRDVAARFPGLIKSVRRSLGDTVKAGETLAVIESNLSLEPVALTAPMAGVISARAANPGEQTGERVLFTITDPASVWAELAVFPRDRARVQPGAQVRVRAADGGAAVAGLVSRIGLEAGGNQAVTARVVLDNRSGALPPGSFVSAEVEIGSVAVPLAVKSSGLQQFRDHTVVFEQIGDQYEVRMLELGRRHGAFVEVLDGLKPGAIYVSGNSYLIKADIEKSGAAHDH